jgi:N-acetylmuramoyl-L-alanine amidase
MAKRTSLKLALLLISISSATQAATAPQFLVILDPGHGGSDTGAIRKLRGKRIAEKNLTLAIALETQRALKSRGIASVLTRTSDRFIPLDSRTAIANRAAHDADSAVFVSIHANSSDEPKSSGAETYVFNASTNQASQRLAELENGRRWNQAHATLDLIMADLSTTSNYSDSVELACQVQKSAVSNPYKGVRNRGVHQALFYVLMQAEMPSILFEPGFVSNPNELEHLASRPYQKSIAQALTKGILAWKTRQARNRSPGSTSDLSAITKPSCLIR